MGLRADSYPARCDLCQVFPQKVLADQLPTARKPWRDAAKTGRGVPAPSYSRDIPRSTPNSAVELSSRILHMSPGMN